ATAVQLRCRRRTAHRSNGCPARTATAFSPPKRTDRPPAMTTPTTDPATDWGSVGSLIVDPEAQYTATYDDHESKTTRARCGRNTIRSDRCNNRAADASGGYG